MSLTLQWCVMLSPASLRVKLAGKVPEWTLSHWTCAEFPPLVVAVSLHQSGLLFQTRADLGFILFFLTIPLRPL